ncbi:oligosaccharide flippase family protein [Shewanella chilikensis]|uniref:oligosaccharide flippase family protein n=1 Tax=Shewanella chilikensis TaxID=558541 RepID=UPI003A96E245
MLIRRIGRNAIYNVAGVTLPSIAGILAIPILLANLGADRVGIFTLAMGVVGFAGVFDLGIGRALTQSVASAVGANCNRQTISRLIRRALTVVFLVGFLWGGSLWAMSDSIVHSLFSLEGALASEAVKGVSWLSLALPGLLLSSSLIGVLEGLQRFALVNVWRVPLGVLVFMVPALCSFHFQDIGIIIGCLVMTRLAGLIIWAMVIPAALAEHQGESERYDERLLWRFTGWLTVSNVVGPLMVQVDRFYLASLFPPASVAYYTVPLDTLFRMTSLPVAAMNAVFPALAQSGSQSPDSAKLLRGAAWFTLAFWVVPVFCVGIVLKGLLTLWLGAEFAGAALLISQWILLGVLINGFAHIPYALLQSAGRSDITAKLHLVELPMYLLMVYFLVSIFGVLGAAVAWTLRIALDTFLLYSVSCVKFSEMRNNLLLAARIMVVAVAGFTALILVGGVL